MNRIYQIDEGRPIWKRRPTMLLLTLVLLLLTAVVLAAIVLTGPVSQAVGDAVGLGSTAVAAWRIAKWPLLLAVVIVIVALLCYATPNVKQPRLRWSSMGAFLAIVIWALLSAAFGFYVCHRGTPARSRRPRIRRPRTNAEQASSAVAAPPAADATDTTRSRLAHAAAHDVSVGWAPHYCIRFTSSTAVERAT